MTAAHRTGTVTSGDVTLFYRHFGSPGATPMVILHGAQYYDSADWIEVAAALARGREVVAYDRRGFGESSWSPSKNYSTDAHIDDLVTLLDHLGWKRAVIFGHSLGGMYALTFASRQAARTAGLILGDSSPGGRALGTTQSVNNKPKIYPTLDAVEADLTRDKNTPVGSAARARLESFVKPAEGGYVLAKRDPDFMNTVPLAPAGWTPTYVAADMWTELANVSAPILIVRGTKSDRYSADALAKVKREFANATVADVESGHDIAGGAAVAVVDAVGRFLTARVDRTTAAA